MRSTSHSTRKSRAAFACTLAAACLASASTSASAADPGLPSIPQLPKPPALPQLPNVAPPPVQLPAPPSAPQVPVPRAPDALPVPAPSLPGTSGGAGRAAPGAGALPGQGGGGSAPYTSGSADSVNGTAAAGPHPAARRRQANRRLQRSVRNLQGCLSAVDGLDRRVLVLRGGLGGRPAGSRQSVARRLDVSPRRVARAERSGLKSLRGAARGSSCESGPSPMAVSRTPWLMPLTSASTGMPLMSMASLAGDPSAEERSHGAVLGVTRSDGAESPGSLVTGEEAERRPKRVAASTGDSADVLLPLLLSIALLALLAAFVVIRNSRRSPSIIVNSTALSEARAAPWVVEAPSQQDEVPAAIAADSEPRVEDEAQPTPVSHRTRNTRLAASAAALAAGGVIRALLRIRRRR